MKMKSDDSVWWQDLQTGALVRERPGHYAVRLPGLNEFSMIRKEDWARSVWDDVIGRFLDYKGNNLSKKRARPNVHADHTTGG